MKLEILSSAVPNSPPPPKDKGCQGTRRTQHSHETLCRSYPAIHTKVNCSNSPYLPFTGIQELLRVVADAS